MDRSFTTRCSRTRRGYGGTRLPSAKQNQQYYEGRVGGTRSGARGPSSSWCSSTRRRTRPSSVYYTDDHYTKFIPYDHASSVPMVAPAGGWTLRR